MMSHSPPVRGILLRRKGLVRNRRNRRNRMKRREAKFTERIAQAMDVRLEGPCDLSRVHRPGNNDLIPNDAHEDALSKEEIDD